jgi:hypothetical protein
MTLSICDSKAALPRDEPLPIEGASSACLETENKTSIPSQDPL